MSLYFIIHSYFLIQIIERGYGEIDLWFVLYIPLAFSLIVSIFTYIVYHLSHSKANHYLIMLLVTGSTAFFLSSESGLDNDYARLILIISFLLHAWFFYYFIFETLKYGRIIKRSKNKVNNSHLFLLIIFLLINIATFQLENETLLTFTRLINLSFYLTHMAIPISILIKSLANVKDSKQRSILIWLLSIQIIAFGPFIFLNAIPAVFEIYLVDPYLSALGFFAFPIGFSYITISKKIIDFSIVLNRLVYYSGLAALPSLFITLILFAISTNDSNNLWILYFFIIFIFILLLLISKEQFDFYFRKSLFNNHANFVQFIERISKETSSIMSIKELEVFLKVETNNALKIDKLAIVKKETLDHNSNLSYLVGDKIDNKIILVELLNNNDHLIEYKNILASYLIDNQNTKHYLVINRKNRSKSFTVQEKSWFLIFSSYIKPVYENILLNEQLVKKNSQDFAQPNSRLLFQLAEKERNNLANDIHDTIIQEQIYWYRYMNNTLENNNMHLQIDELIAIRDGLFELINKTREVCTTIRPNLLTEKGILSALQTLVDTVSKRATFSLSYEANFHEELFTCTEKPIVIYRVMEELLNNAMKHSNAKRVSIFIWCTDESINIDYLDDGIGFNKLNRTKKTGLSGVINRIHSIDGVIEFETDTPGSVLIYITIPK